MATIVKHVPVKLNSEEHRARSVRLAQIDRELQNVKAQKKAAVSKFSEKAATLEAEREELIKSVESGEEDRPVTCREEPNLDRGVIEFVRTDTPEGERVIVGHRPMTSHEKQLSLPETEPPKDQPLEALDPDGQWLKITPEQADALRAALARGETGEKLDVNGVGERYCTAVRGGAASEAPQPPKRRRRSEVN
jgi:hypothetical protein